VEIHARLRSFLGTMATAIVSRVLESCEKTRATGGEPKISRFIATVHSQASAERLSHGFAKYDDRFKVLRGDNLTAMRDADIVLLACKPYMAEAVLGAEGVRNALQGKLVLSVLVGSPVAKLEAIIYGNTFPKQDQKCYIQRAMLNIAAELGESMTVIETTSMPQDFQDISNWVFSQVGKTAPVAPELFDIGGVIAGTTNTFLSVALDGILDGAVSQGLKRADARKIATQSLFGLAKMLERGEHPAVLREKSSSPKGTTIDGLLSLEEDRVRYAFSKAVIASSKRSQEIGK
jgi:pyrroline-5-carboxylate reductase